MVREDAPHHAWMVDQGDHPHRPAFLTLRHASGSASRPLRGSRTQATLARVANSLTGASAAKGVFSTHDAG